MRKINLVNLFVVLVLVLSAVISMACIRPSAKFVPLNQMLRVAEGADFGVVNRPGGIEIIEPYQEDSYSQKDAKGHWVYPRDIVVKFRVYGLEDLSIRKVRIIVDDHPAIDATGSETKVSMDRPGWHTIVALLCDKDGRVLHYKNAYDISRIYMGVGKNTFEGQYGRRRIRYYNFDRQPSLSWNINSVNYPLDMHNNVPVDFYLRHIQLDEKRGPWIKVVLDNKEYTYIKNWNSYIFNRLEGGVHQISVQLCDRNGKYIPNATNHITHTITINPHLTYFTPNTAEETAKNSEFFKEFGTPVPPKNGGH